MFLRALKTPMSWFVNLTWTAILKEQIYSGWINQGQKAPIYSRSGKIDVNYRQASSDQTFGRDDVDCSGGRVISVP